MQLMRMNRPFFVVCEMVKLPHGYIDMTPNFELQYMDSKPVARLQVKHKDAMDKLCKFMLETMKDISLVCLCTDKVGVYIHSRGTNYDAQ